MKRITKVFTTVASLLLLGSSLTACTAGGSASMVDAGRDGFMPSGAVVLETAPGDVAAADSMFVDSSELIKTTGDQQAAIIKSGNLRIQVADPAAAADQITQIAVALGGGINDRQVNRDRDGNSLSASILMRVPSAKFDEAYAELAGVGVVLSDMRNETDVSLQRADLSARVDALQASVTKLNELLTSATQVTDLVEIESALSARQQELDAMTAQLRVLEDQISLATIWVDLTTVQTIPGGPANFWEGLVLGFESLGKTIDGSIIVFGVLLPWLATLAILAALVLAIIYFAKRAARAKGSKEQPRA